VVSRNVNPFDVAVVSICSIHGGITDNLIVDDVTLTGSARTMRSEVQERVLGRVIEISDFCAQAYGCTAEFDHYAQTPPLINSPEMTSIARIAAGSTVSSEDIVEPAGCMASDDFAEYGRLVPSFFYFIGSGICGQSNPSWHNAHFRADPDTALWGASLLTNSVLAAQGVLL
jgi:metal-dependent amidase/aminoacylase/carboxypeptidase family protein